MTVVSWKIQGAVTYKKNQSFQYGIINRTVLCAVYAIVFAVVLHLLF